MIDKQLLPKQLFNPGADDANICMMECETTNLIYLNRPKYPWAVKLYKRMREQFWTPEIVDMTQDVNDIKNLSEDELRAYKGILGFLVFLDSLQSNNLANVIPYITAPEVVCCLIEQESQEANHSMSYQTIFEAVFSQTETDEIYYWWREDKVLLERNEAIAKIYQDFVDEQTFENFIDVLIADLLLEGLYFYNGFQYFYNLASRGLMNGTADMIRLINIDELSHITIFKNILKEIVEKSDEETRQSILARLEELTDLVIEQEIYWSTHIMGEGILGINEKSIKDYTYYLANKNILAPFGITKYSEYKNPYAHLDKIANLSGGSDKKGNFFESNSNTYSQVNALKGFSDF
jgi:ribonucleoside-diphosphate reductase beta chain